MRTLSFRVNLNATGSMRWANDDGTPSEDSAYKVIYVVITYAAVTVPTMMDNPLGQDNHFIYEYTGNGFDVYLYTPDNRVYFYNYSSDYYEDAVYDNAKKAYKIHVKQAAAVVRTLSFRVYLNTSSMRWANDDGTPSEDGGYRIYYVEIVRKKMPDPVLEGADATNPFNRTVEYSPTAQIALKINQIPSDAFSISRSSVGQTSWEGDEFVGWITAGASIGSGYTVTVTPKGNWSWADGSTDAKVYRVTIDPLSIKRPTLVGADADNPLKQTFVYDYGAWPALTLQFEDGFGSSQITTTSTTNSSSTAYFTFKWATATGTLTVQTNSESGTAATGQATTSGRTFTVAPTSNYRWEDDKSSTPMTFTMAVVKRAVKIPVLVGADENNPYLKTFPYDDIDGFTFVFNDADQNNLNYKVDDHWSLNSWENNTLSVTRQQALATDCPVTISLKNTSYMYWDETGSPTGAKSYAIGVGRYTVDAPVIKGEYVGSGTSCLMYTSPRPRDWACYRMPSSA
ncbi:MAG: hypothetical protein K2L87_05525, partial [Clostridiales bacterium]|nr:hypothetical protein [Clostridiales bacterium]